MMGALNDLLDRLPTTTFGSMSREVPAYRTCGVIGYYAALIVSLGVIVITGGSPLVMASVSAVCGLSFFAWAYLRRWLGRGEKIVLLEHVWFALVCSAGLLAWLGQGPLPYLDAMAVALPVFLAAGRIGCFFVGCCHGKPSRFGVTYGERHASSGFPSHLLGVRLFPLPLIEAVALLVIAMGGVVAIALGRPGTAVVWFLASYAVTRFGLESLRGDQRSFFLGLSTNRWLCLAQFGAAMSLGEGLSHRTMATSRDAILAVGFLMLLGGSLIVGAMLSPRRRLLDRAHVEELTSLIEACTGSVHPEVAMTSLGASVAASSTDQMHEGHVSFTMPAGIRDLETLCAMASVALPGQRVEAVHVSESGVLHLLLAAASEDLLPVTGRSTQGELDLYGRAVRSLQANRVHAERVSLPVTTSCHNAGKARVGHGAG